MSAWELMQASASGTSSHAGAKRSADHSVDEFFSPTPTKCRKVSRAGSSELAQDYPHASASSSHPEKRLSRRFRDNTRLRLALVELMQELFMESMRDGEITSYERNTLQMAAIVLSQVNKKHGKDTHVSMAGESMEDLKATFPEVVEFMKDVSTGMKEHFLVLKAKGTRTRKREDNSIVMQGLRLWLEWALKATGADVQDDWKVSPEELLACFQEEDEEDLSTSVHWLWVAGMTGWAGVAHCTVLACWSSLLTLADENKTLGLGHMLGIIFMGAAWTLVFVVIVLFLDRLVSLDWLGRYMSDKFMMRSRFLDMCRHRQWMTTQIVLDASKFFALCFAYVGTKGWLDVLMVFLRIRVVLCFASGLPLMGRVVYPFCFFAEQVMEWKRDHWLLGCLESGEAKDQISAISWAAHLLGSTAMSFLCIPGGLCASLCVFLTRDWHGGYGFRFGVCLACGLVLGSLVEFLTRERLFEEEEALKSLLHLSIFNISFPWMLQSLLDFFISTGMCTAYRSVADAADKVVQPILMLRSLKLGSDIRRLAAHDRPVARRRS